VFDGFDDIYVKAALLDNFDKKILLAQPRA
jgi:hypothetical protein